MTSVFQFWVYFFSEEFLETGTFNHNTYLYNVIQNVLGCTVGSFLAIFFAYHIYRLGQKQDVKKQNEDIRRREDAELGSFARLLAKSIQLVEVTVIFLRIYAEQRLAACPNEFPSISVAPTGILRNLLNTVTWKETSLIFVKRLPGKRSFDDFLDILQVIEFLDLQISDAKSAFHKKNDEYIALTRQFNKDFRLTRDLLMRYNEERKTSKRQDFDEKLRGLGSSLFTPGYDLQGFKLIYNSCFKEIATIIDNSPAFIQELETAKNLYISATEGRQTYESMMGLYSQYSASVLSVVDRLNEQIKNLKRVGKNLLNDFVNVVTQ